ncbi:hypothetical protein B0T16DRAFT_420284 [Cercophora newfieldiana]|uniref:Uncharacterized protein n=1 Tax=Cercophora newfieldiana TaxID=92897 RepID=A0AA39XYG5_9PEZI|nr:hypothetical protein B0T16DRAFT_420284 [Cercophora newfieldiana]
MMRLNRIARLLSITAALVAACNGLPLEPRGPDSNRLAPRATYAVVPIYGGAGQAGTSGPGSGSGSGDVAITVVTTVTSLPTTGRNALTNIPIVDIELQPKTTTKVVYVEQTTSAKTSTTLTSSSTPPQQTPAGPATDKTTSTTPMATVSPTTPAAPVLSTTFTTSTPSPSTTSLAVFPTTSTAYDDGMWHTTYPPWNGTKLNWRASRPRLW